MARKSGTIVYLDEETKQLLAEMAFHEHRSQSGMILKLIRDAAAEMGLAAKTEGAAKEESHE